MPERDILTPQEDQRRASSVHGYGAIHLTRAEDDVIVTVQVGELWVPIIREFYDDRFDHTAYPLGIEQEIALFFATRKPLFEFTSHRNWVSTAHRKFGEVEHSSANSICIDSEARIVTGGNGFVRAEREGAYPIRAYSTKSEVA